MISSHWHNIFEVFMPTPDYGAVRLWCLRIFRTTSVHCRMLSVPHIISCISWLCGSAFEVIFTMRCAI